MAMLRPFHVKGSYISFSIPICIRMYIELRMSRRRSNDAASSNRGKIYIAVSLLVVFPHLSVVTRC